MATNQPQPVDVPVTTTIIPASSIQRQAAPVPPAQDPGIYTPPPPPVRPSVTQPDEEPNPYQDAGPAEPTVPVEEQPVSEEVPAETTQNITPNVPVYITVQEDGTVVVSRTTEMNFTGPGVSVTGAGSTATVNITGGGSQGTTGSQGATGTQGPTGGGGGSQGATGTQGATGSVGAQGTSGTQGVQGPSGGGGGSYGDANVVALMASFGSNTISTTGNITASLVAPDGEGSVLINNNGLIGAVAGFNYVANAQAVFMPSIDVKGSGNTGVNAIYTGPAGYAVLGSDVLVQITSNVNAYTQINQQNLSTGNLASADYIITADNGNDTTYYLDIGLAGSNHADSDFFGDTATSNDGYFYVTATDQAGPSSPSGPGNLIIGSTNGVIKLFVGNTAQANVVATVASDGVSVVGNITADYFFGNGSQLTGLSTGSISNGTSNVEIATADGNVTINTNGTYAWSFDDTGNLTLPNNGSIVVDGGDGVIGPVSDDLVIAWDNEEIRLVSVQGSIEMQADNAFRVQTNYDGGTDTYLSRWEFSQDEIVNITGPSAIVTEAGDLTLSGGRDGLSSGNVSVVAVNNGVVVNTWNFDNTGNLTLPPSGNIVGATANNAGRIQWLGNSSGDGAGYTTLGLIPDETLVGNDQYLIIDPTAPGHIHIRAGGTQDASSADLFLGGENTHFKVAAGANSDAQISANSYIWTFVTTGNLELPSEGNIVGVTPNNIGHLQWVGNSSGDGGGYTTLQLVPDNTVEAGDQYLIIDPTGGGHIHIRAGGTQDSSNAILFIGGENSYVSIGSGSNPPVTVQANNYSWSFGTDSTFSAAGNIYTLGEVRSGSTVTPPVAVANLTPIAGSRAFANDANLVAAGNFGQQVTGGASNTVPVWSDGTNWYIG